MDTRIPSHRPEPTMDILDGSSLIRYRVAQGSDGSTILLSGQILNPRPSQGTNGTCCSPPSGSVHSAMHGGRRMRRG
jgi:hypothetical protein